jgi:hypothetical protein
MPKKLPVTHSHLEKITIDLHGTFNEELEVALCIFRSAPKLKTLSVGLPRQNIWEEQRITDGISFQHLEMVRIVCFKDDVAMLGFAKFLLTTAPKLEKIIDLDHFRYKKDALEIVMKLASFPRLSSKAVIVFDRSSNN